MCVATGLIGSARQLPRLPALVVKADDREAGRLELALPLVAGDRRSQPAHVLPVPGPTHIREGSSPAVQRSKGFRSVPVEPRPTTIEINPPNCGPSPILSLRAVRHHGRTRDLGLRRVAVSYAADLTAVPISALRITSKSAGFSTTASAPALRARCNSGSAE